MAPKQKFIFDLTDEEKADQSRIVAFAERLPAHRRTGGEFMGDEAKMRK